MDIHHIFIFSNAAGDEANDLLNFGLSEGSFRIHQGQGTQNRKFYFENFYLEIVWISNEKEFRSEDTALAKLYERAHHVDGFSPFGLCLVNSEVTDILFNHCEKYYPAFLPEGMGFDIITNYEYPSLPWTFRPPFRGVMLFPEEPKIHKAGIQNLTRAAFHIPKLNNENAYLKHFINTKNINFEKADKFYLALEFDNKRNKCSKYFENIPLIIDY
jgi:hypothetical protein